jgi:CDP-6-deoxy-D-xylo-4-hexulose-3-dehydrase
MNLQVDGSSIYEYGDVITHSFYHPHHVSSFGGGAVIAQLPEAHNQIQSIVHWGRSCRCHYDSAHCDAPPGLNHNFWYQQEGINVEMSELNACFGRWQLQSWPDQEAKRWKHWRLWEHAVAGIVGTRTWQAGDNISPFVFPIGVDLHRYVAVTNEITAKGVEVRTLMGGAIHLHPAFQHLAHSRLKQCERTGSQSFFVGMHQTLETEKIEGAIAIVRDALKRA